MRSIHLYNCHGNRGYGGCGREISVEILLRAERHNLDAAKKAPWFSSEVLRRYFCFAVGVSKATVLFFAWLIEQACQRKPLPYAPPL